MFFWYSVQLNQQGRIAHGNLFPAPLPHPFRSFLPSLLLAAAFAGLDCPPMSPKQLAAQQESQCQTLRACGFLIEVFGSHASSLGLHPKGIQHLVCMCCGRMRQCCDQVHNNFGVVQAKVRLGLANMRSTPTECINCGRGRSFSSTQAVRTMPCVLPAFARCGRALPDG